MCVRVRLSAKVGVGSVRRMCKGLGYGGCMLVVWTGHGDHAGEGGERSCVGDITVPYGQGTVITGGVSTIDIENKCIFKPSPSPNSNSHLGCSLLSTPKGSILNIRAIISPYLDILGPLYHRIRTY